MCYSAMNKSKTCFSFPKGKSFTRSALRVNVTLLILVYGLPMCLLSTQVRAESIECPSDIRTTQSVEDDVLDWEEIQQGTISRLIYTEIYAGPIEDGQSVEADEAISAPDMETLVWHFQGTVPTNGTWLACSYENTYVKLVRRLPDNISTCTQVSSTEVHRVIKLLVQKCE